MTTRVRIPKEGPVTKLPKHLKTVGSIKKFVDRPQYPSTDLPDLNQYEVGRSQYIRDRWLKTASSYMRAFVSEGCSRSEIKKRLGIDDKVYDELEMILLETEGSKFTSMGTAHRYYVHMLRIDQCIRELDIFIRKHMDDEDAGKAGIVGAIKAKAALYTDLMKMGQDLGIVSKRAKELRVLGEINLAVLPNEEIQQLYKERMSRFQEIIGGPKPALTPAYKQILNNVLEGNNAKASGSDEDDEIEVEWEEAQV